jgi:C4-dicarboxylate-specific signal transduction histidine kinase
LPFEKALKYAEESIALAKQINDQYSMAVILITIATAHKHLGDRNLQKNNLELSLSYSEKEQYRSARSVALQELAKFSEEEGDFQKALHYYWQYQEIKDYLTNEQKDRTIQQIRMQLKVEENERALELIRKTNKQLEKKNRLINKQKKQLEKAEKELIEWNHSLEERVKEEIEKRRQQEQFLMQKSKLESLGRMAAGIAHEINQPLGMLNLGIQNLLNKFQAGKITPEYLSKKTVYFQEHIERIGKIIEHVRLFSRDQKNTVFEKVDINEVISNVLSMLKMQCRNANITITTDFETELFTIGNKYRIEQVLLNVLCNAKDALEDKFDTFDDAKTIFIRSFQNQNKIRIEIEDNGCGIPKQCLEHIFDPFYTTKSEQRGTGLGLSICYGILQDMNGKMDCESSEGIGTKMIVSLPAYFAKNESVEDAKS